MGLSADYQGWATHTAFYDKLIEKLQGNNSLSVNQMTYREYGDFLAEKGDIEARPSLTPELEALAERIRQNRATKNSHKTLAQLMKDDGMTLTEAVDWTNNGGNKTGESFTAAEQAKIDAYNVKANTFNLAVNKANGIYGFSNNNSVPDGTGFNSKYGVFYQGDNLQTDWRHSLVGTQRDNKWLGDGNDDPKGQIKDQFNSRGVEPRGYRTLSTGFVLPDLAGDGASNYYESPMEDDSLLEYYEKDLANANKIQEGYDKVKGSSVNPLLKLFGSSTAASANKAGSSLEDYAASTVTGKTRTPYTLDTLGSFEEYKDRYLKDRWASAKTAFKDDADAPDISTLDKFVANKATLDSLAQYKEVKKTAATLGIDVGAGTFEEFQSLSDDRKNNINNLIFFGGKRYVAKFNERFAKKAVEHEAKTKAQGKAIQGAIITLATFGFGAGANALNLSGFSLGAFTGATSTALKGGDLGDVIEGGLVGGLTAGAADYANGLFTGAGEAISAGGALSEVSGFTDGASLTGNVAGTAGDAFVSGLTEAGLNVADGLATSFGTTLTEYGAGLNNAGSLENTTGFGGNDNGFDALNGSNTSTASDTYVDGIQDAGLPVADGLSGEFANIAPTTGGGLLDNLGDASSGVDPTPDSTASDGNGGTAASESSGVATFKGNALFGDRSAQGTSAQTYQPNSPTVYNSGIRQNKLASSTPSGLLTEQQQLRL